MSLRINTIFLSGASIFLKVNNVKHLYIKRNSDILWNRMQNSHDFLSENRRFQRELGCAGKSLRLRSPSGDRSHFFCLCWCISAGKLEKY